jgi:hypothetical protein
MDNLYKDSTIIKEVRELDKILDKIWSKARRQDTWLYYIRNSSIFREER